MPWHYRIDEARGWLFTTVTGAVTDADVREHLARERDDGHLGLPELIDGSNATAAFSPAEVRSLVNWVRVLAAQNPFGPTAVACGDDYTFGMLRMLEILIEDVVDVRAFRSLPEAEAWLIRARVRTGGSR